MGGGVAEGAGGRRTKSRPQAAHESSSGQETTTTTLTATLAELFEVAAKAAHAERERAFEEKKLREERAELEALRAKLEAQLRAKQESVKAQEAKLSERERACAWLSHDVAARRAVDWSRELPSALWERIAGHLAEEKAVLPFALTCRRFREVQKRVVVAKSGGQRRMRSKVTAGWSKKLKRYDFSPASADWCEWACGEAERAGELPVSNNNLRVRAIELAAYHGHLQMLRCWKKETRLDVFVEKCICESAALGGHLDVLRWARENKCSWSKLTCSKAAFGGHLEVLRWARENGCEWDERTCRCAALGGHLEVLKWARANGCPWNESTCRCAADGGHLEVLRWARENGCPWDEVTCYFAAKRGHLEVLKWARENGCPWNAWTCAYAVQERHLEVLRWARENGCPWNEETRQRAQVELNYSDEYGNLSTLRTPLRAVGR